MARDPDKRGPDKRGLTVLKIGWMGGGGAACNRGGLRGEQPVTGADYGGSSQ